MMMLDPKKKVHTVIVSRLMAGGGSEQTAEAQDDSDPSPAERAIGEKALKAIQGNDPVLFFAALRDAFSLCEASQGEGEE